jgi:riboflavin synthase
MFTGLIQSLGHIHRVDPSRLWVQCPDLLPDLQLGDSIAVDGLCLTVAEILSEGFLADISPETLRRSTLDQRQQDQPVNLERSLRVGEKIGGHFVTGHIDGVGTLSHRTATALAWELTFTPPPQMIRYIVPKGSIAINGISLTVAEVAEETGQFRVAVIPHTYHNSNLSHLQPGDAVNLEGDILSKYVEKLLGLHSRPNQNGAGIPEAATWETLSLEFLAEHGYR